MPDLQTKDIMNIIENIMTRISIENIIMCMLTIVIVFLLYGYFNGLFRKETRQDFIIKVKRNCKLLLEIPFTIKLMLLLCIMVMVFLMFAGVQNIKTVLFLIIIPLSILHLIVHLIVGNRNNIVINIIITCIALFIVYIILSISLPDLISF